PRATRGAADQVSHLVLVQPLPVVTAEDELAAQMPVVLKRRREPQRHRNVPQTTALWRRDLALPIAALNADLPFDKVDVRPPERPHLARPQSRFAAEEHDQVLSCV